MTGLTDMMGGGGSYQSGNGMAWHKVKVGNFRAAPVLGALDMTKPWFPTYVHKNWLDGNKEGSGAFVCPIKTNQGDFCPACALKDMLEAHVESLKASGVPEFNYNGIKELARKFAPKWEALTPTVYRGENKFGWSRWTGKLIGTIEAKAAEVWGTKDIGMNAILNADTGYDITISKPDQTSWGVAIDGNLPLPMVTPGDSALLNVITAWFQTLTKESCKQLHRDLKPLSEMMSLVTHWANAYAVFQVPGVTMPVPPGQNTTIVTPSAVTQQMAQPLGGQPQAPQQILQPQAAPIQQVAQQLPQATLTPQAAALHAQQQMVAQLAQQNAAQNATLQQAAWQTTIDTEDDIPF